MMGPDYTRLWMWGLTSGFNRETVNMREIWCLFLLPVSTLASIFWINSSLFRDKELQKFDVWLTNAWVSFLESLWHIVFRILMIMSRWKKAVPHICLMCMLKDTWWSKVTLRWLAVKLSFLVYLVICVMWLYISI